MTVYLDCSATTKPDEQVVEAMMPYLTEKWQNPSSLYVPCPNIKADIETARKTVGDFINANANDIYFTGGGCESNSLAIEGFVNNRLSRGRMPCVITTKIEHKSIIECVKNLNFTVTWSLDVDEEGFVYLEELEEAIKHMLKDGTNPEDVLISIGFANSEIGTIQNIKAITRITKSYGVIFHTDAVQMFSKMPIDVRYLGIDMLSASGHKLGTPKGIGFLYVKNGTNINPIIYGSQENGLRGGTENVAYIMGLAKAVELHKEKVKPQYADRVALTRDFFIEKLEKLGCVLNGSRTSRLPNNINITLPDNIDAESFLYVLDMSDIKVSSGSACNSKAIEGSYVIKAIGKSNDARSVIRITFPDDILIEQIYYVVEEIESAIKLLKNKNH